MLYLDTSGLVKLFVQEEGTDRLMRFIDQQGQPELAIVSIAKVEFHSAVQRRYREGDIDQDQRNLLLQRFEDQVSQYFITQPTSSVVTSVATNLLEAYPLRAYDAIQLAGCLCIQAASKVFICADNRLISAARGQGLTVFNPTV